MTAISALLFYFGYVSSRSQYEYFGLDVDTIGLTTQDFIMRSPQPLLVPLLVLSVLGASAVFVNATIKRRLTAAYAQPGPAAATRARHWIGGATIAGWSCWQRASCCFSSTPCCGTGRGSTWSPRSSSRWGGSIAAYAIGASRFAAGLASASASGARDGSAVPTTGSPATPATSAGLRSAALLRPAVSVFILVAVAASIFWATATVAQWSGTGLAQSQAQRLDELPSVILDTRERLYLTSPGLSEAALPPSPGQTFRYRYRHLRLLIQGNDRMFLVPDRWSPSDSTLLVRLDPSVRMHFQFINQAP